MVHLLDQFLVFEKTAVEKWRKLSRFRKLLISFMFFTSILSLGHRKLTRLPPQTLKDGRVIHRVAVDLTVGWLIVGLPEWETPYCIVMDIETGPIANHLIGPSPN